VELESDASQVGGKRRDVLQKHPDWLEHGTSVRIGVISHHRRTSGDVDLGHIRQIQIVKEINSAESMIE
jgi:hypothetical protein